VGLVNHQHDFYFRVDVQQSLNEERVGNFVLLSLVVLEPGTVIEGQIFDDDFVGDGGLRVLFVANLDGVSIGAVQDWLQSVVADEKFSSG
jgi:hypothetical protein